MKSRKRIKSEKSFDNLKFEFILLKLGYGSSAGEDSNKWVIPVSRQEIESAYTVSEDLNVKFLIQGETRKVQDATLARSNVITNLPRVFKMDNSIRVLHFFKPTNRTRRSVWQNSSGKKTRIRKK